MKTIRCDNVGETNMLEKALVRRSIIFEHTVSGTPQQIGVGERGFATLYNQIRSMMYSAGIYKPMR